MVVITLRAASCRTPHTANPATAWDLVLRHAVVAHPLSPLVGRSVTIAIAGDRIDAIFEEADSGEPLAAEWSRALESLDQDVRVVDVAGHWLLPGYIDAHVHFLDSAGLFTSPDDYDLRSVRGHDLVRAKILADMPATMARYLCAGITTAVGLGGASWETGVRDRLSDEPRGARLVTAGPFFANFPVGEFTLWTDEDPVLRQLRDVAEAEQAVDALVAQGVDLAKIGIAPVPDFEASSFQPILEAFVASAHERGLRVAVHAEQLELAKLALRAGVDVLAHTVVDRLVDQEFIELAVERDVVITSGLSSFRSYADVLELKLAAQLSAIETRCGDPAAIASWEQLRNIPPEDRPETPAGIVWGSSDEATSILLENTRRAVDAGIRLAVGTNGGQIGTLHGPGFHRELDWLTRSGLTADQIIVAATTHGASVYGDAPARGSLEPGQLADLVLVEADPRDDVRALAAIGYVVRGGHLLDEDALVGALSQ